jgi:autotransporter-associated beta strand protein
VPSLPSGSLDNEGTLIFDHSDNIVVGVGIPGAGSLVQNGSGTLTLAAANAFSGSTTVSAGTLVLSNSAALASTSQINVTGGTLDVSGVAGKVQLNNLSLTGAGLTVSASATQTNLFVNSLTLGGANNTINIALLPSVASYPATVTVLQTAGGISGFNFRLGTLPAGSAGSVALSDDSTAVLLTLTSGPISLRPSVTWVGLDFLNNVSTNWSDRLNWQLPGEPVAGDNVIFNNNAISINGSAVSTPGGGIASLISAYLDNIVDANFSIASLTYTNAGGLFHNTFINSDSKLTITNYLIVGGFDTGSTLTQVGVSISGTNATLDVENTNGTVQVWLGSGSAILPAAMLDLSALDTFTANISQLGVGACTTNNAVNRPGGILYLARTNTINCTIPTTAAETGSTTGNLGLIVGDCNQNNGSTSTLFLGQVNSISADAVAIARQKTTASMSFNPALVNIAPYPTVTFKGFTTGIVSNFDVGDGVGNTGTTAGTGTVDLTGGIVTATVDMLNVGRASAGTNGSGTTTGVMGFDAGTITANTVNIGIQPVTGSKAGVGTMNVNSNSTIGEAATLVVNGDLNIGVSAGGASAASTGGTLNINGGTVQTANIIVGTNTSPSIINLTSGTLAITGTAGTPDAPITTLNLSGNLQLNVNGGANVTNIVATSVNAGGPISLQINSLFNVTAGVVYPLISYPVGSSDPFSSLSLTLPSGYVGVLVDNSATGIVGLQLSTVPVVHAARLTSISLSGTTLNITGTGGSANGQFVLLGSTNITTPLNQWTPILTNSFDGSGNLNLSTNIVNPAVPVEFYILLQ